MINILTELIKEAIQYADNRKDIGELYKPYEEYIAEYLMDNNTIVTPCKVGDMAYFIVEDKMTSERYITSQRINDVSTRGIFVSTSILEENCEDFEPYNEFSKTVFLTKEEAEKALKEGAE